ncbi:MAG TPA: hypothetical protein EYG03_29980 [Planctomycetes bacterium]|nr:hypothetical protein [Fuerstiella sp.]HIK96193.1 hypothetical protein [Planctomycetota bacterium]
MNIQTIVSIDTLTDFLKDGDALVNFTSEAIASLTPAVSISQDGTARLVNGPAYPVNAEVDAKAIIPLLADAGRLVVVTDGIDKSAEFVAQLSTQKVPHIVYVLEQICAADAFMDEEDSEAVAERLRQLGYI